MVGELVQGRLGLRSSAAVASATRWLQGLFHTAPYTPEESLFETKGVDPRLLPRVPMSNSDIDVSLLNALGKLGMKRGKLITEQSHPELMKVWHEMSARAGLKKAPQLILTESKTINALTVSPEEVVITTGLLKLLDLREVTAVLGHELAHENSEHKKPRILATAIFGGAGAVLGHSAGVSFLNRRMKSNSVLARGFYEFLALSVGAWVGSIVANQVSVRPTELEADRKGAAISGDPEGLALALTKLQDMHKRKASPFDWVTHLHSGYPATQTRIDTLRAMAKPAATPVIASVETPQPTVAAPNPGHAVTHITVNSRLEAPLAQHAVS